MVHRDFLVAKVAPDPFGRKAHIDDSRRKFELSLALRPFVPRVVNRLAWPCLLAALLAFGRYPLHAGGVAQAGLVLKSMALRAVIQASPSHRGQHGCL